jgi:hypothetical protein
MHGNSGIKLFGIKILNHSISIDKRNAIKFCSQNIMAVSVSWCLYLSSSGLNGLNHVAVISLLLIKQELLLFTILILFPFQLL